METIDISYLYLILLGLLAISAFFSASETAMMALNRYRLRHMARSGSKTAQRVSQLLERPDRLLGVVLIGNTFANIMASSVATIIGARLYGNWGIAIAALILTFVVLIFSEVAPKTLAATHPQSVSFKCSFLLKFLLKLFYPFVWIVNGISNGILSLFKVKIKRHHLEQITQEELRTLVSEAGPSIPDDHQDMLLAILGLENVTVEDVMIPRHEIVGIDIDDSWDKILQQLKTSQYTRLPFYKGDMDHVKGFLHVRSALNLLATNELTKRRLLEALDPPYFIPETTRLHTQLLNFREYKARIAFVVDEYGDVQGLVTLEDILEEIVGEYTTDVSESYKGVSVQPDGGYLVDGSLNIRDLNRLMNWNFDTQGPKTLNGLITEILEAIPQAGICLKVSNYKLEIVKVKHNRVRLVKVLP